MTSRAPAAESAIWAVHGGIWKCVMLALPTTGTEGGVLRLLIALLFAPHPLFADPCQSEVAAFAIATPSIGSRRA
jgi:hypothetical protein